MCVLQRFWRDFEEDFQPGTQTIKNIITFFCYYMKNCINECGGRVLLPVVALLQWSWCNNSTLASQQRWGSSFVHLSFCISSPGAWESQGQCGCCCLSSWEAKSICKACGKQGTSILAGLLCNTVGESQPHGRAGDFLFVWSCIAEMFGGISFFVVYCTNLFLSFHYGFGLRADLHREIAFFSIERKKKYQEMYCAALEHIIKNQQGAHGGLRREKKKNQHSLYKPAGKFCNWLFFELNWIMFHSYCN